MTTQLPTRTNTTASDDGIPPGEDTSEATKLLYERLQAWKHACGYLEDYISSVEKMQNAHAKEYEKVLKTVNSPLKEAHHFDTKLGGIAEMFDNIRSNTQAISNSHSETAKALHGTILPIFTRLHTEIKNKTKELDKGVGKGSKSVDKAKQATDKLVESLGSNAATYNSPASKMDAANDPYVLRRRITHSLHKQIQEENNHRGDLLQVQTSFSQFETHIVDTFQNGIGQFYNVVGRQADMQKTLYGNMTENAQRMDPLFEWNGFVSRHEGVLINPNAPPRTADNVDFANSDHPSTKPVIAGSLERKGAGMSKLSGWNTSYTVVTPSRFLHEFKTNDDIAQEPTPSMSLYLPNCTVGGCNDSLFNVRGKNVAGALPGMKEHEYAFKAHSAADADQWWRIIRDCAGKTTDSPALSTPVGSPTSPAESRNVSGAQPSLDTSVGGQQTGTTTGEPGSATVAPQSATAAPGSATAAPQSATATPQSATGGQPASAASAASMGSTGVPGKTGEY